MSPNSLSWKLKVRNKTCHLTKEMFPQTIWVTMVVHVMVRLKQSTLLKPYYIVNLF
jgi:hypothetical protein